MQQHLILHFAFQLWSRKLVISCSVSYHRNLCCAIFSLSLANCNLQFSRTVAASTRNLVCVPKRQTRIVRVAYVCDAVARIILNTERILFVSLMRTIRASTWVCNVCAIPRYRTSSPFSQEYMCLYPRFTFRVRIARFPKTEAIRRWLKPLITKRALEFDARNANFPERSGGSTGMSRVRNWK